MGSIRRRAGSLDKGRKRSGIDLAHETVHLQRRAGGMQEVPSFSAHGFMAQHVDVAATEGFDYSWQGSSHYVALHDLELRDGETRSDFTPVQRRLDLRGAMTFVPAGSRIWGWSEPRRARNQSFTALYFNPSMLIDELAKRVAGLDLGRIYFSEPRLQATLAKLRSSLRQEGGFDSLYVEQLCSIALMELGQFYEREARTSPRPVGAIASTIERRIRDYVDANLTGKVSLTELANIAGLSRFHFIRAFRQATRQTPYQFVLQCRVERAKVLLDRGASSVADVAVASGFADAARFIRAFKAQTGTTPGAYRSRS